MRQTNSSFPDGQKTGWFIFECVMAILYLGFGGIFLFSPIFGNIITGGVRIGLGIVLALYGIFRVFRAIRKIVQRNE